MRKLNKSNKYIIEFFVRSCKNNVHVTMPTPNNFLDLMSFLIYILFKSQHWRNFVSTTVTFSCKIFVIIAFLMHLQYIKIILM